MKVELGDFLIYNSKRYWVLGFVKGFTDNHYNPITCQVLASKGWDLSYFVANEEDVFLENYWTHIKGNNLQKLLWNL